MAKTVIGLFDNVSEAQRVRHDLVDQGFQEDAISFITHQGRAPGGRGAAADDLLAVLTEHGVPADEAHAYADGVRRGGAVVMIDTEDADAERAAVLMRRSMTAAPTAAPTRGAEASSQGGKMETIERTIDIAAPVETAYQQWTHFEQFPQFMEGVEEVRRLDAKRLHWVASIGGTRKEWEAVITEERPNERIAWRSEGGEFNSGLISFQPLAPGRSRVTVQLQYEPKGLMERAGDALGLVSRRVEGDLERFKQVVEARGREGAARHEAGQAPSRVGARTTEPTAAAPAGVSRFEDYEKDFQQHYRTAWAGRGQPYEHWAPAYRYGYALATDPRYRGRDWSAIETEARRQWEERHQGSWEEFKEAVRYGWDTVRGRHLAGQGEVRIPVVEEELQVGTRQIEHGGVRVYSRVTEQPVEKQVSVREEHVHVERRPVDRPASEHDLAAFQEGTIEMTETTEEPVVRKQARVVEEVVIDKDVEQHTETVRDTVRRTEVDVEPLGSESARGTRDFGTYESDFRQHYTTGLAGRGYPYEHWAPAYRYGYELASDPRYTGRDWTAIEAEARRDWEQRHRGTWEEFKETIRYAWDKIRGRR